MVYLKNNKALVTGASTGIGKAVAQALHKSGCQVVLSATRENLLKENVEQLGGKAHYLVCDMHDKISVGSLVDRAAELMGGIDILICNAGINRDGLAMRMTDQQFEEVLLVNLTAAFILNRAAVKHMIKERKGVIINMSSIVAYSGNPGQTNYSASKAGLGGMTRSLALEVASRNITVNCIAPGFIDTAMTQKLTDGQQQELLKHVPMGRMGTVEEIADLCVFLASESATYITGQTLHVNGGLYMI